MEKDTVLSLSPNQEALAMREATLRSGGLKVISVLSPIQARFEIEMGRCGIFVICYRVSRDQAEELTGLFRKNCPEGRAIFVTRQDRSKKCLGVRISRYRNQPAGSWSCGR